MVGMPLATMRWHGANLTACAMYEVATIRGAARGRLSALGVEVLAHHEEVRDLAGQHALERRAASERRGIIRCAHPLVRGARVRQQDLQGLVDAEQVRQPLERVAR